MAILPLVEAPDVRLKEISTPVESITPEIHQLLADMLETMYSVPGIGLAAIQVGIAKRIIVMDLADEDQPPAPKCFINPEIVWSSNTQASYREGCLSVPTIYADVQRPESVRIRYLDKDGNTQEELAEGLYATCIQHEIDHLNGILFIDHFSKMQKNYFLDKLEKSRDKKRRKGTDSKSSSSTSLTSNIQSLKVAQKG